ncbi:hypothetical protein ECC02_011501 [Trypanosoma cruzi]|uniref:Uncharacterized protein n=1 Tax=Trypanosoma cruzi TaxID=5693 RepID=A0A7J6XP77_TRYCR|nr:hypothetical protein ECC02_011501 [Trypanosoma cruzi]
MYKSNNGGPQHRLAHADQDARRLGRPSTPKKLQHSTLKECAHSERDVDGEMQRHTVEEKSQHSTHAAERHTHVAVVRLPHVQREARQRLAHHAARVAVDGSLRQGRHNRVGHLEGKTRRAMPSVLAAARARAAVHRLRPGQVARHVLVARATPEQHHTHRKHTVVRHLLPIPLQVAPHHKARGRRKNSVQWKKIDKDCTSFHLTVVCKHHSGAAARQPKFLLGTRHTQH